MRFSIYHSQTWYWYLTWFSFSKKVQNLMQKCNKIGWNCSKSIPYLLYEAPHRVAWLRDWPYFSAWLRENDFISAWLRESTCVRDAWKRRKMCVISWNHSKTCVISWKACFSPNFSVFAWKFQFFIDCVNAWKWKKICVIAWLGTPLGGLIRCHTYLK